MKENQARDFVSLLGCVVAQYVCLELRPSIKKICQKQGWLFSFWTQRLGYYLKKRLKDPMPKSKHWFRTNAMTKDFLCLGIKTGMKWSNTWDIPNFQCYFQFYWTCIYWWYTQEPRKILSWALELKDCSFNFYLLRTLPNGVSSRLSIVHCQLAKQLALSRRGSLIITHLVLAEVANAFNETRNLCILPLLLFFNDSTFNESRISAFPPTETNRVPMAQQTRIDGQDTLLILIRDH